MADQNNAATVTDAPKDKPQRSLRSLTIDGVRYEPDQLSAAASAQLANIRVVDREIRRLQSEMAIAQAARVTFARSLREALVKSAS